MDAIIQTSYEGIRALKISEVQAPTLTPISAIIRNQFTPVLPYDWMTEEGKLRQLRPVRLPLTIGYGFAGIVDKVGRLRDKKLVGKRVMGANPTGASAEFVNSIIPPLLFEVPEAVSLNSAATIIGGADAAYYAVNQIEATKRDTVLITGASGGVGVYLIQLLKLAGTTVITLGSSSNISFLKRLGADYVVDYDQNLAQQFFELPNINKVIDTVGSPSLLDQITTMQAQLKIFSLSLQNYTTPKRNQQFDFGQGSIGLGGYKKILKLLADQAIFSIVQQTFDYKDVINAQLTAKEQHSHGRILLSYGQTE